MRASELRQLIGLLVLRPIKRHKTMTIIWCAWAYISIFAVGITNGSIVLWLLVSLIPGVVVAINAPFLWIRNRPERKQLQLERLRANIERLEREIDL
jgi:hypothetical protein